MDEPLLKNADGDCAPVESLPDARELFIRESKKLLRIAVPISINAIFTMVGGSAVQIFAGGLGPLELSAVSVAFSVITDASTIILAGMSSALDTLCGQAFGAGQLEKLGTYMKFSCIVQTIFALLMCPSYIFLTPILKFFGQDHQISALAGKFAIRILPQLFATALSYPSQKFLYSQSKVAVLTWIGFGGLILNVGTLLLFTHVFAWGLDGAALSISVSSWATCLAQLAYVLLCSNNGLLTSSLPTFEEMWAYIKLALASAFMFLLEGGNQIVWVLITGLLDNPQIALASLAICNNIKSIVDMMLLGMATATSVRVSNELGSCHPRAAKHSITTSGIISISLGVICASIIVMTQKYLPVIFTSDKELQVAVVKLVSILSIHVVLRSIQPIITAAFVGGGWQHVVAYIELGCYTLGIFLQFIFGFKLHWRVQGTWGGMLCGIFLQNLILSRIIWKLNWKDEATKASKRLEICSEQNEIAKSQAIP